MFLWGQLMRLNEACWNIMAREEFNPYRSALWSDETEESAILVEVDRTALTEIRLQKGPPVTKSEDSISFPRETLEARNTLADLGLTGTDGWSRSTAESYRLWILVKVAAREEAYGLSLPKQLGESSGGALKFCKTGRFCRCSEEGI